MCPILRFRLTSVIDGQPVGHRRVTLQRTYCHKLTKLEFDRPATQQQLTIYILFQI